MATVRHFEHVRLEVEARHTDVNATWSLVNDRDGNKYLQIDTYGSSERKLIGKKSQSIRFGAEAVEELKRILAEYF